VSTERLAVRRVMVPGPGTVRVGRFIGKVGVVTLPAVEAGLGLDERVVRRHVAKLETAGWLERMPWVWGEGSVVWLTGFGLESVGLGGVRAVKTPPSATTIAHSTLAAWSAARVERIGQRWRSARELAVERERWAIPARSERGYTTLLPDLAVWGSGERPFALIAESGGRREDRQRMILEAWRDAILAGRYSAVRYDCSDESVARWINRLANKLGLGRRLRATVQTNAQAIAALGSKIKFDNPPVADESSSAAAVQVVAVPQPSPVSPPPEVKVVSEPEPRELPVQPEREQLSPDEALAHLEREALGPSQPARRRPWRR